MRISNIAIKRHLIDNVQSQTQKMDRKHVQMTTGRKNLRASDSPIEAINSIYSRVRLNQITQYQKNILDSRDHINVSHGKIGHSVGLLQRLRELNVQAANGTYNADDRKHIAMEVEELLRELVQTANAKLGDKYLYSGSEVEKKPFVFSTTNFAGIRRNLVEKVDYVGDSNPTPQEIEEGEWVKLHVPGNEVFWGQPHAIVSLVDARNYAAPSDQVIRIDGKEVFVAEGDKLDAVVSAINNELSTARAFAQTLENGNVVFAVEATYPHQLILEDVRGGTVLQDLGMLVRGADEDVAGRNIQPNTIQHGGSIFEAIITFRNNLLGNQTTDLSSQNLASITDSLNSLLESQSQLSSLQERLDLLQKELSSEAVYVTERLSQNEDVDVAEASIQLKQIQNIHRISLMTASKYITPTLMDYLD